jgi:hypothetical protein
LTTVNILTDSYERRKVRIVACEACGCEVAIGEWPWCPHGFPAAGIAVIDDQLEGGPRRFDVLEGEPYIATKSDLKREMEARGLVLYDRHDSAYYRRRLKRHDEELRDTGTSREY